MVPQRKLVDDNVVIYHEAQIPRTLSFYFSETKVTMSLRRKYKAYKTYHTGWCTLARIRSSLDLINSLLLSHQFEIFNRGLRVELYAASTTFWNTGIHIMKGNRGHLDLG